MPDAALDYRGPAIAAWGDPLPDWIDALVASCEARGQRATAQQLGCSLSAVSALRRGRYGAGTAALEARIRGALMAETVACPAIGTLSAARCTEIQGRPRPSANPIERAAWAACRSGTCPHSRIRPRPEGAS